MRTFILLGRAEDALRRTLEGLLDPWVLAQLAILGLILAISLVVGPRLEARLEGRVRAIQGQPRLLRFLALLLRRTRWILATLLAWLAVFVIRAATLDTRSALLELAAALVASWVAISVLSRLIRNRTLGRLAAYAAWAFVALNLIGAADEAADGLDAAALTFGSLRISLLLLLKGGLVIGLALWIATGLGNLVENRLGRATDLTPSLRVLLGKLFKIGIVVLAGVVAVASLGIDLTAFTVFSGALGVGIGFGLQQVVSNFVSGIIILADKSIKPGDTISLGDTFGWIRSLRARFVSVVTRDGVEYLIPNEDFITNRVVSWSFSDTKIRVDVRFGVAYDSDPHAVRRLAVEAAKSVPRVEAQPVPVCHLTAFGESSLDFILRFWICDPQNGLTNVRGAVLLACWDAFKAAGIAIPFPHREIIMKTPVELSRPGPASRIET
ncbi:mechanosensitive ion channel [Rhizobiales bacterium L72]|uniref:Mechanosensitive ion channel n=1 Tax=Propylenella binzhouense TaxID=2555902 RepID=A0A964WUZ0_9HYPH|nr:mechanosensitive ion channel [Propylenella binzhouense]